MYLGCTGVGGVCLQLAGADLDSVAIEEGDLSPEEWQAFQRALAAGQLSHLVPAWQPWWLTPEARALQLSATGQAMVQHTPAAGGGHGDALQLSATGQAMVQHTLTAGSGGGRDALEGAQEAAAGTAGVDGDGLRVLPEPSQQPLQPVASLTKVAPSPLIGWQLAEVLYAYCFVQRRFNGEAGDPGGVQEAVALVMCLSPCLGGGGEPPGRLPDARASIRQTHGRGAEQSSAEVAAASGGGAEVQGTKASAVRGAPPPVSAAEVVLRCLGVACQAPAGDLSNR